MGAPSGMQDPPNLLDIILHAQIFLKACCWRQQHLRQPGSLNWYLDQISSPPLLSTLKPSFQFYMSNKQTSCVWAIIVFLTYVFAVSWLNNRWKVLISSRKDDQHLQISSGPLLTISGEERFFLSVVLNFTEESWEIVPVFYVHSCSMEGGKVSFSIPHETTQTWCSTGKSKWVSRRRRKGCWVSRNNFWTVNADVPI